MRKWVRGYGWMEFTDRTRYFMGVALPPGTKTCGHRYVEKIGWWVFINCDLQPDPFATCPLALWFRACPLRDDKVLLVWLELGED